jgi:hypothetical protein
MRAMVLREVTVLLAIGVGRRWGPAREAGNLAVAVSFRHSVQAETL